MELQRVVGNKYIALYEEIKLLDLAGYIVKNVSHKTNTA